MTGDLINADVENYGGGGRYDYIYHEHFHENREKNIKSLHRARTILHFEQRRTRNIKLNEWTIEQFDVFICSKLCSYYLAP